MRFVFVMGLLLPALAFAACGEKTPEKTAGATTENATPDATPAAAPEPLAEGVYDIGCRWCVFDDEGFDHCQMGIVVDGKHYDLRGEGVPAMHCEGVGKAVVAGEIRGDEVVAAKFELEEE